MDTDVVSFLFKGDTRAALYRPHLERRRPVITAQTLAELHHWPVYRNWGAARRAELETFLSDYPVVYPDEDICRLWGVITALAAKAGRPVPPTDAWQAATAMFLSVPLVTHNPRNYLGASGVLIVTERK